MNAQETDLSERGAIPIKWGIVYCVYCCPRSWTAEQVSEAVTLKDAPGTSLNEWVVSEPRERKDEYNGVNRLDCPVSPDRVHWLLNC